MFEPHRSAGRVANEDAASRIRLLEALVRAQEATIQSQAAALADSRATFERAAAAARIGLWECVLPTERLTWSDGVCDIFEVPRGARLSRAEALDRYEPPYREELTERRTEAIAAGREFSMDAAITTFAGRRRWIRITATVDRADGRPIRLFGIKQDITEEKSLAERFRRLAEQDPLTGLANRSRFQARLDEAGMSAEPIGALILVDLDGFKAVNDGHGHAAGDACLKEAARRLLSACPDDALVARIGGDEFAVVLGAGTPDAAEATARRIVEGFAAPVEAHGRPLALGASVGVARSGGGDEIFLRADAALYAAKAAGRGTFRVFGGPVPPRP